MPNYLNLNCEFVCNAFNLIIIFNIKKYAKQTPRRVNFKIFIGIKDKYICRVATAQGKQGIWFLLFPDRENTGNFALTQGKILRHRENIFL